MTDTRQEDTLIDVKPLPRDELRILPEPLPRDRRAALILVADDEPAIAALVCALLREEGHETVLARDGQLAIEYLAAGLRPDLVLLDLMMPRVPGRTVIAYMKNDPRFSAIPIVAMSAGTNLKNLGLEEHQPDALLAKPFDIDALAAQVALFLRKR